MEHRELPPADELLKPRDRKPIIVVSPQTWTCQFCDPQPRPGSGTTVEWIGPGADGADGRCRECGQLCLARGWANTKPKRKPEDEQAHRLLTEWRDGRWPYKYCWWARGAA